jgi:hypothetical protein
VVEQLAMSLRDEALPHAQEFGAWKATEHGGHTCHLFLRLAMRRRNQGYRKYGAKCICEIIRWHYVKHGKPRKEWAINNNYPAHMARWAATKQPCLEGFFEQRELGVAWRKNKVYIVRTGKSITA